MWAPSTVLKNRWFLPDTADSEHGSMGASEYGSIWAWETITHNPTASEWERERRERTIGSVVIMCHSASHTPVATGHSFIKLKFIRNVCPSCGILTEQVTCNPRFYSIPNNTILHSAHEKKNASTHLLGIPSLFPYSTTETKYHYLEMIIT